MGLMETFPLVSELTATLSSSSALLSIILTEKPYPDTSVFCASVNDCPADSRKVPRSISLCDCELETIFPASRYFVAWLRTGSILDGIGTGTSVAVNLEAILTSRFSFLSLRISLVLAKSVFLPFVSTLPLVLHD
jgi:hypothetical protein